jgi:hypothetical protein
VLLGCLVLAGPLAAPARAAGPFARLESRIDLRPPVVVVARRSRAVEPGLIFLGPKKVFGARPVAGAQGGPMIVDDAGRVRWFRPMPGRTMATDVRVQQYRGRPVLTWWQGRALFGQGDGECVILDTRYRVVARVRGGDRAALDLHECRLTDRGTLLAIIYVDRRRSLASVGGRRRAEVVDGIVQEIDVATGRVLMSWSSLDDVALRESYEPLPRRRGEAYDYVHLNSVAEDTDGNLLVSARHTWAVYKLDRRTGRVIYRLGGKRSDFRLSSEGRFAWQHDAQAAGENLVRIFDNSSGLVNDRASGPRRFRSSSRVVTLRLDPAARTATPAAAAIRHPLRISVGTQGNAALLDGSGDLFVGWGSRGRFSEFDPRGRMLFDARMARGFDSYRAYRSPWSATPLEAPQAAARAAGERTVVSASWNGATEVAAWRALAGRRRDALAPRSIVPWRNLETRTTVATAGPYFAVEALDAAGGVLRRSAVVRRSTRRR